MQGKTPKRKAAEADLDTASMVQVAQIEPNTALKKPRTANDSDEIAAAAATQPQPAQNTCARAWKPKKERSTAQEVDQILKVGDITTLNPDDLGNLDDECDDIAKDKAGDEDEDAADNNLEKALEAFASLKATFCPDLDDLLGISGLSMDYEGFDKAFGILETALSTLSTRGNGVKKKPKASKKLHTKLDRTKTPISTINDIFETISEKAEKESFLDACNSLAPPEINIVTMCSGTESPILAMRLLQEAYYRRRGQVGLKFKHMASAEIEPKKQAYIQRNFKPPIMFRDVTEFIELKEPHTAYGATREPPKDVHMLIAGASCVDYSTLNNKPKVFGEKGESFATINGIRSYAERERPPVIILENVKGAPWQELRKFWAKVGYYTQVVQVDSKNYYIPHTRQRGYMIAVDKYRLVETGMLAEDVLEKWVRVMKKLQQRASAPYADFILADDDPHLQNEMRLLASAKRLPKDSNEWSKCLIRHVGMRSRYKLGTSRPVTKWQNNGGCRFVDFGWQAWARIQRERIWDQLDICHLDYVATRNFDMGFKCRSLDLSQNVDRNQDRRAWGIISCLTPSGMPYDTRRGGPIVGREALALQGIPVDDLILSKETSRDLQDLAGNAMTTTVVGVAIVGSIIAGTVFEEKKATPKSLFKDFSVEAHNRTAPESGRWKQALDLKDLLAGFGKRPPQLFVRSLKPAKSPAIQTLLHLAKLTLPLCNCVDLGSDFGAEFQMCTDCGHTACKTCGRNPEHNYREIPKQVLAQRQPPSKFIEKATAALPKSLQIMCSDFDSIHEDLRASELLSPWQEKNPTASNVYLESVAKVLRREVPQNFHFQAIKRGSRWRIIYNADDATLELQFGPLLHKSFVPETFYAKGSVPCQWLLFAKPPANGDVFGVVRKALKRPIARMLPSKEGDDFLSGAWQVWKPATETVSVSVPANRDVGPSWEKSLGLTEFTKDDTPTSLDVQHNNCSSDGSEKSDTVSGQYQRLQKCGAANGSLHKRIGLVTGEAPMFLFLDPEPHGDAIHDSFVFSYDHTRMPYGVSRTIQAQFKPCWRLPKLTKVDSSAACHRIVVDRWRTYETLQFRTTTTESSVAVWQAQDLRTFVTATQSCKADEAQPILVATIPLTETQRQSWKSGRAHRVDLVNRPLALVDFHWVLKNACHVDSINVWHSLQDPKDLPGPCSSCTPAPPPIAWKWTRKERGKKLVLRPFEEPQQALTYENAMRERPDPLAVEMHCSDGQALLEIRLNIAVLLHRTLPKLGVDLTTNRGSVDMRWRIAAANDLEASPDFETPRLLTNNEEELVGTPPGFLRPLWDQQKRALNWMIKQEKLDHSWDEWEREEMSVPAFNWRLEAEGLSRKDIKGGVLADEVGGGKTTTSLALVANDLSRQGSSTDDDSEVENGYVISRATLILVPESILGQWYDEFLACFGQSRSCKTINGVEGLENCTVEDICGHDIILAPWNIFDQDAYWSEMRSSCWAPHVPASAGRGFQQWLTESLSSMAELVRESKGLTDEAGFWSYHGKLAPKVAKYQQFFQLGRKQAIAQAQKTEAEEFQFAHPMPSESQDEAFVLAVEEELNEIRIRVEEQSKKKVFPLLHFFKFRRLIVDEFTYLEGKSLLAVLQLQAGRRWMLSGTPPLTDFDSINTMAKLLGTKICSADEQNGIFDFGKEPTGVQQSYREEFLAHTVVKSPAWKLQRNEQAHKFVHSFIRQNLVILNKIHSTVRYQAVVLTATEAVTYQEMYQHLMSQSFRFLRTDSSGKVSPTSERSTRLSNAISNSVSPEHALLVCSSTMRDNLNKSTMAVIGDILGEKHATFKTTCIKLRALLRQAWARASRDRTVKNLTAKQKDTTLEDIQLLREYAAGIGLGHCGDDVVSKVLMHMLACAYDERRSEEYSQGCRKDMVHLISSLNILTMDLIKLQRENRLFSAIRRAVQGVTLPPCSHCKAVDTQASSANILGSCGHVVCTSCSKNKQLQEGNASSCFDEGCYAAMEDHHLIPANYFVGTDISAQGKDGSKMHTVLQEIKAILEDRKNERILVFVQYKATKNHLYEALQGAKIKYVDGTYKGQQNVEEYQKGSSSARVLVLMLDSQDAAGWYVFLARSP